MYNSNNNNESGQLLPSYIDLKKHKEINEFWTEFGLYNRLLEKNKNGPNFVLHDGPPFTNGKLHLGHTLNLLLKAIINRFHAISGFRVHFFLGWDGHGLPIESQILKSTSLKKEEIRSACHRFSLEQRAIQEESIKKLGILTNYPDYYLTTQKEYEAEELRLFAKIVDKGLVFRDYLPLNWSCGNQTVLAENEIEYWEARDVSLFFKLKLLPNAFLPLNTFLLVWTTQPWTIPHNMLVAVRFDSLFLLLKWREEFILVAKARFSSLFDPSLRKECEIISELPGKDLENLKYEPLYGSWEGYIVDGQELVKENEGTGVVHLAPACGPEDFKLAQKEGLQVFSPVDPDGSFNEKSFAKEFIGKKYTEVNELVIEDLSRRKLVFKKGIITHSCAHDWRDKSRLIFRLTEQWFIRVAEVKERVLKAVEEVQWVPSWGKKKITAIIQDRGNWCISRQKLWGLPLPVFYKASGEPILNSKLIERVAYFVEIMGSEAWFDGRITKLLKAEYPELLDSKSVAGLETLDVWIDSGSSFFASLRHREKIFPADLYLEGADQFRGWFLSSLILSVIVNDKAPYKIALTHGFVVDEKGKKMSKSLGNVIDPELLLERFGPDVLSLWVADSDFSKEIKISEKRLENVQENYKKIYRVLRYLANNVLGFRPELLASWGKIDLQIIDFHVLQELDGLMKRSRENYKKFKFNLITAELFSFCTVLSKFYLEITKDVLKFERRSNPRFSQVMVTFWFLLKGLLTVITPILPFLAESVFQQIASIIAKEEAKSVFLIEHFWNLPISFALLKEDLRVVSLFMSFRESVLLAIEKARQERVIAHQEQAIVDVYLLSNNPLYLRFINLELSTLLSVSEVSLRSPPKSDYSAIKFSHYVDHNYEVFVFSDPARKRCSKCKRYRELTLNSQQLELCARCLKVAKET